MIFIGLELTGLSLYLMTDSTKPTFDRPKPGSKYFLFGSTASAFTLFGSSLHLWHGGHNQSYRHR